MHVLGVQSETLIGPQGYSLIYVDIINGRGRVEVAAHLGPNVRVSWRSYCHPWTEKRNLLLCW